jgi:hypothetical protein
VRHIVSQMRTLWLFRLVQEKLRDPQNGGWTEHAARDFGALPFAGADAPGSFLEKVGFKCSYAMMHWMEALGELYQVTGNAEVRTASIRSSLRAISRGCRRVYCAFAARL